jgi:arylsulfatase A-like enzyme
MDVVFMFMILTVVGVGFVCAVEGAEPRAPNFIVVLIDDMGWRDIGASGSRYFKTPNIDRLATQGMRFTQGYAACAVCSPTRAALMTGKYPARLHITDWIRGGGTPKVSKFKVPDWTMHLPGEEVTVAEALKQRGYVTAHIGKWHLGGKDKQANYLPETQGFDINIAGGDIGHPNSYFFPYGAKGTTHGVPHLKDKGGKEGEYLTDRLTDEAITFIESAKAKPFFLYLAHYAVHSPFQGKPEYVEEFKAVKAVDEQKNAVYAAMVKSVDDSMGRLMDSLRTLGLADNTVIIFTSDNGGVVHCGPATSNKPLRAGKGYPYEGGIREPFIVKAPGVTKPGSVCDVPVITMDIFPTVLSLAGSPDAAKTAIDGLDITPLLKGDTKIGRDALYWHYPHYWFNMVITPYSVVRAGDWKLVRWYESAKTELYNLADDQGEKNDLAASNPGKTQELRIMLDKWLKDVGAQMPVPR